MLKHDRINRAVSDPRWARALEMLREGAGRGRISRATQLSYMDVRQLARDHGLPIEASYGQQKANVASA